MAPVLATGFAGPEAPAAIMAAQGADAQAQQARELGRQETPAADAAVLTNAGIRAVLGRLQAEPLLGRSASGLVERLPPQLQHWAVKIFADLTATGGSQYALGAAHQLAQNAVNKGLVDSHQNLGEGVAEAGASAAIAGGVLRAGGLGLRSAAGAGAGTRPGGLRLSPRVQAIVNIISHQRAARGTLNSSGADARVRDAAGFDLRSGYPASPVSSQGQSQRASIQPGEITTYRDFRARSVPGDRIDGHEEWQHANLKAHGHVAQRLRGTPSLDNPVIAVDRATHTQLNRLQSNHDATSQTPLENINANAEILRKLGIVSEQEVVRLHRMATAHAKRLGH